MITSLPPAPLVSGSGGVFASIGSSLSTSQDATSVTITPATGNAAVIPAATDSLAGVLDAARAAIIDNLAMVATSGSYGDLSNTPDRHAIISMMFDGGGAALVAPITRYVMIPFAATITGWAIMADQSGSITIDVWKEPQAGFPPTIANTITAGAPMTLASQAFNQAPNPTGWTTTINAGDVLAFNISASSTVTAVTVELTVTH